MPSYPPQWARRQDLSATRDDRPSSVFWAIVFLLTVSALFLYMLMQLMPAFSHSR
jgi:hypothetical protein